MEKRKELLGYVREIRARNNDEWMRLVALSLECDQIKNEVEIILRRITVNDQKIQAVMKELTRPLESPPAPHQPSAPQTESGPNLLP